MKIKIIRYKLLKFKFKPTKRGETMELEKEITAKIRKTRGIMTPEKLAHTLKTDIHTIKDNLKNLQKTGQIKLVTWENLLETGK